MVLNILTLGATLQRTTVNMKAPIIININNGLAISPKKSAPGLLWSKCGDSKFC